MKVESRALVHVCSVGLCIVLLSVTPAWSGDPPGTTTATPTGTPPTPTETATETPQPTPTPTLEPRCKDCAAVKAYLKECSHLSDYPNPVDYCAPGFLYTILDSASCKETSGTGRPKCNTDSLYGQSEAVMHLYAYYPGDPCVTEVGGNWTQWQLLFYGCGDTCEGQPYMKACDASNWNPDGNLELLERPFGVKKKCGCEEPPPTPTPGSTDTTTPTSTPSSTPPK